MLKRGDIILVHTPGSIICWLIREITSSHWNHVAWVLGPNLALESQAGTGVRVVNTNIYRLDDTRLTKVVRLKDGTVTDEQLEQALVMAQTYKGSSYDWWLILQLGWLYLRGKIKRKAADDWDSAWICSELIAKPLWRCAGFLFQPGIPAQNTVPGHIATSPYVEPVK